MMKDESRELHVHLGVDSVFEDLFERLFEERVLNEDNTDIWYITAEVYRHALRNAVDSAATPAVTFQEKDFDRDLLISRPRMLFPGSPLNCSTKISKLTYKLENIQHIFSGRKILFHLFLTDHISYLYQHQKYVAANPERALDATWRPLIEALVSKVLGTNELQIWNAEDSAECFSLVLDDILRVPKADQGNLLEYRKSIERKQATPAELAAFRDRFSLRQEFFDRIYRNELSYLQQYAM